MLCTTVAQRTQHLPSLESIMLRSQTLHLLPAICISVLVPLPRSTLHAWAPGFEESDQVVVFHALSLALNRLGALIEKKAPVHSPSRCEEEAGNPHRNPHRTGQLTVLGGGPLGRNPKSEFPESMLDMEKSITAIRSSVSCSVR